MVIQDLLKKEVNLHALAERPEFEADFDFDMKEQRHITKRIIISPKTKVNL